MKRGFELIGPMLQGEVPERVPVICNLFEQGARQLGMSIKAYYADYDHIVRAQIEMAEKYGYDNLWATYYSAIDAETLGSKNTIFAEDGPPNVGHLIIKDDRDIAEFTIPDDLSASPVFEKQMALVTKLKQKAGGQLPVCALVVGSFSLPVLLMGIDKWLTLLLTGAPDTREALLSKCSEYVVRKAKALREAGADLIAYANPIASATFINAKQFDALAAKWVRKDFAGAGSDNLVYFSGGGKLGPLLDRIVEASGAAAYYLNSFDDIPKARQVVGRRGLLIGMLNDIKLMSWTRDEIRREVKKIMDSGKPGGGFLLGTQMMPYNIPEENIHCLIESAHEFGYYA